MDKQNSFKRICLWSGPRNISTTLMYSFAQRPDTSVYDEPLYAHYLVNSNAQAYHPGTSEILASQENDGEKVIQHMLANESSPVQFYKQMTHHLIKLDREFMNDVQHILLTRDPKEMLPSYAKVIEQPTLKDVGYHDHCELINYFNKESISYIVIDAKRVLLDPETQLRELCIHLDIPFYTNMLNWEKGARPEDGVWAPYWYRNIHNSTGFIPYQRKTEVFPEGLIPLLHECKPYYEQLLSLAI